MLGAMADARAERRGEDRGAITLRVDYRRLNTFFADYTKNISKGGTFIQTTRPLEIGTELVLVLTIPAPNEVDTGIEAAPVPSLQLELRGKVRWIVEEADASPERPPGMGIEFLLESDAERARVRDVVLDLMRTSLGAHLAGKLLSGG